MPHTLPRARFDVPHLDQLSPVPFPLGHVFEESCKLFTTFTSE